jgi:hypothetical protein
VKKEKAPRETRGVITAFFLAKNAGFGGMGG